jgi:GTPase SAR1 family protein
MCSPKRKTKFREREMEGVPRKFNKNNHQIRNKINSLFLTILARKSTIPQIGMTMSNNKKANLLKKQEEEIEILSKMSKSQAVRLLVGEGIEEELHSKTVKKLMKEIIKDQIEEIEISGIDHKTTIGTETGMITIDKMEEEEGEEEEDILAMAREGEIMKGILTIIIRKSDKDKIEVLIEIINRIIKITIKKIKISHIITISKTLAICLKGLQQHLQKMKIPLSTMRVK